VVFDARNEKNSQDAEHSSLSQSEPEMAFNSPVFRTPGSLSHKKRAGDVSMKKWGVLPHNRDPDIAGRAILRGVPMAPNKVRRTINVIRGKTYADAVTLLEYLPYTSRKPVLKVLVSAAANAKNNNGYDVKDLYISQIYADMGLTLKRGRPRAQGRSNPILKRSSHVIVELKRRVGPPRS
jgi:large subunit ribosomal protein L22